MVLQWALNGALNTTNSQTLKQLSIPLPWKLKGTPKVHCSGQFAKLTVKPRSRRSQQMLFFQRDCAFSRSICIAARHRSGLLLPLYKAFSASISKCFLFSCTLFRLSQHGRKPPVLDCLSRYPNRWMVSTKNGLESVVPPRSGKSWLTPMLESLFSSLKASFWTSSYLSALT